MVVEKRLKKVKGRYSRLKMNLKEKRDKLLKKARKKAEQELRKLRGKYRQAEAKVKVAIRKNPKKAVLIAAGIGAALGAVAAASLMRKRRK